MKKRITLKLNNKGSGIVTVLIAVVLLTLMGSLLLMLAFTGFEMKASDRAGKQNTYDASTAMDEIKVGIQEAVSESIESSYSYALMRYSEKGDEVQAKFAERFVESFEKCKINGKSLLQKNADGYWYYKKDALESMIVNCRDGVAKLETSDSSARVSFDMDNLKIVFKNVKVSYTDKSRTTTVSADINVAIPDIGYSLSQFTVSGVPSFAAIVGGDLIQSGTTTSVTQITGGAYMKDLDLQSNAQVVLKDGIFVCEDDVSVSGTYTSMDGEETVEGRLIVDPDSTFWANNIIMNDSSTASFLGNTYVNNDLNLMGRGSAVTLSGTYTGFGNGNNAAESSSIIVNGKKNKIDMEGLSNLVLAGVAFVGESPINETGEGEEYIPEEIVAFESAKVKTGESFSVKENQRIYLVPDGYLTYVIKSGDSQNRIPSTNPDIFPDSDSFVKEENGTYTIKIGDNSYTVTLDTTKTLWSLDKNYTFASYGAQLQPVCMIVSNQLVVYYFISFKDTADGTANDNANRYFKDFVAANPVTLNSYVDKYVEVSGSRVASQTVGNFFVGSGEDLTFRDYLSNAQTAAINSNSSQFKKYFSNMCQTLSYNESSSNPNDNPFTYYINTDKIGNELDGVQEFKDENGVTVALVVDGDYKYNDASSDNIHLIIATGDVEVTKDFEGLIFCGGKLNLDADTSLTANSKEVEKAYSAISEVGGEDRRVGYYFKVSIGESSNWGSGSGAVSGKSVASLVTYSNWKKN